MLSASPLVQIEGRFVILLQTWILLLLAQEAIADGESFNFGTHEAVESVFGRADDGLASYVKTGIYDNRTTGALFESRDQRVVAGIGVAMDGLHASGIVDMGDSRDIGARDVEFFNAEKFSLLFGHSSTAMLYYISD